MSALQGDIIRESAMGRSALCYRNDIAQYSHFSYVLLSVAGTAEELAGMGSSVDTLDDGDEVLVAVVGEEVICWLVVVDSKPLAVLAVVGGGGVGVVVVVVVVVAVVLVVVTKVAPGKIKRQGNIQTGILFSTS